MNFRVYRSYGCSIEKGCIVRVGGDLGAINRWLICGGVTRPEHKELNQRFKPHHGNACRCCSVRDRLLGSATNFGTFLIDRSVLRDAWRETRRSWR